MGRKNKRKQKHKQHSQSPNGKKSTFATVSPTQIQPYIINIHTHTPTHICKQIAWFVKDIAKRQKIN